MKRARAPEEAVVDVDEVSSRAKPPPKPPKKVAIWSHQTRAWDPK